MAVLLSSIVLFGCIPSVYPLYTAKDLIFDSALLGRWSDKADEKDGWTFERRDDTSYTLTLTEGNASSPFVAHLVRLGPYRFLDLCPDKAGVDQ